MSQLWRGHQCSTVIPRGHRGSYHTGIGACHSPRRWPFYTTRRQQKGLWGQLGREVMPGTGHGLGYFLTNLKMELHLGYFLLKLTYEAYLRFATKVN